MITSPLAHQAHRLQRRPRRPADPIGLCVHTTGSGIVQSARRAGADPLEWAVDYYVRPDSYHPHYVCGWDGTLVAICDELEVAPHVGFSAADRARYLDEERRWLTDLGDTHGLWAGAWSSRGYISPLQLFPGTTPNRAFIGLELLPLEHEEDGHRFTFEQHEVVAELAADIFARYALLPRARHLVGHEDLNPLRRWDAGGGWDPGARRARPRFEWSIVHARLGIR